MTTAQFSEDGLGRIERHFGEYISSGKIAGCSMILWSGGEERFTSFQGVQDLENPAPVNRETIFRIYSMTKPVASVALMMLWERGEFDLEDPLSRFIPAFADMTVYRVGGDPEPAAGAITIRQLLSHTSGLILPAFSEHPLRDIYIDNGVNGSRSEGTLGDVIGRLAELPLLFHPGTGWEYSMATDVVGHLVEVIDGRTFDTFLQEEMFNPLGMVDTGFHLPTEKIPRFATNYTRDGEAPIRPIDRPGDSRFLVVPDYKSGNGGLLSTMDDYLRFCLMLRNKGDLDGAHILKPETVELMTRNHLDGDMGNMGAVDFGGLDWTGIGFGLGFSVVVDAAQVGHGNHGIFGWSGAASTYFWIDPVADLIAIFFTQFMPSRTYTIRSDLRPLVYQAMVLD
ncbi:MAG: serine hydrolase domain-containing protein [Alphaproteobacteria bacterium]